MRLWAPLALFALIALHGMSFGLTDDEAYYWVLGQRPDLGFAYHPPMVAWVLALSSKTLGAVLGPASLGVVRIPAAFFAALILKLSLDWVSSVAPEATRARPWRASLLVLSFGGLFGLSWMMVPDLPMIAGWLMVFNATWEICAGRASTARFALLALGTALSLLSKFSAVFASISAFAALAFWARPGDRLRGMGAIILGSLIAAIPILAWNATHEWAAILYQFRDRHGRPDLSGTRYARFWLMQLFFAGPALVLFAFSLLKRARGENRPLRFALLFSAPAAAVFCLQPLWAEFKGHWAFVVWLPVLLFMATQWVSDPGKWRMARAQVAWGVSVLAIALLVCHVPFGGLFSAKNPKLDVSNDLYGWDALKPFVEAYDQSSGTRLPIAGSRYQTAGQASFSMADVERVTLWPRGAGERGEWPEIPFADAQGVLARSVLYVADNRYSAAPSFKGAKCEVLKRLEATRWGYVAKWIDVWRCDPAR